MSLCHLISMIMQCLFTSIEQRTEWKIKSWTLVTSKRRQSRILNLLFRIEKSSLCSHVHYQVQNNSVISFSLSSVVLKLCLIKMKFLSKFCWKLFHLFINVNCYQYYFFSPSGGHTERGWSWEEENLWTRCWIWR